MFRGLCQLIVGNVDLDSCTDSLTNCVFSSLYLKQVFLEDSARIRLQLVLRAFRISLNPSVTYYRQTFLCTIKPLLWEPCGYKPCASQEALDWLTKFVGASMRDFRKKNTRNTAFRVSDEPCIIKKSPSHFIV